MKKLIMAGNHGTDDPAKATLPFMDAKGGEGARP